MATFVPHCNDFCKSTSGCARLQAFPGQDSGVVSVAAPGYRPSKVKILEGAGQDFVGGVNIMGAIWSEWPPSGPPMDDLTDKNGGQRPAMSHIPKFYLFIAPTYNCHWNRENQLKLFGKKGSNKKCGLVLPTCANLR